MDRGEGFGVRLGDRDQGIGEDEIRFPMVAVPTSPVLRKATTDMLRWTALAIDCLALVGVVVVVLTWVGSRRWSRFTDRQEQSLLATPSISPGRSRADFRDFDLLPAPGARYLKLALRDGQSMIQVPGFLQNGQLRTAVENERWMRFDARVVVVPQSIGFAWEAKVRLAPARCTAGCETHTSATRVLPRRACSRASR